MDGGHLSTWLQAVHGQGNTKTFSRRDASGCLFSSLSGILPIFHVAISITFRNLELPVAAQPLEMGGTHRALHGHPHHVRTRAAKGRGCTRACPPLTDAPVHTCTEAHAAAGCCRVQGTQELSRKLLSYLPWGSGAVGLPWPLTSLSVDLKRSWQVMPRCVPLAPCVHACVCACAAADLCAPRPSSGHRLNAPCGGVAGSPCSRASKSQDSPRGSSHSRDSGLLGFWEPGKGRRDSQGSVKGTCGVLQRLGMVDMLGVLPWQSRPLGLRNLLRVGWQGPGAEHGSSRRGRGLLEVS